MLSDQRNAHIPTCFRFQIDGDWVTFNVMPGDQMADHLQGFTNYIRQLDEDDLVIQDAEFLINQTRTVLGLVTEADFEQNELIWHSLFQIAEAYNGFIFVFDSLVLPNGAILAGPLKDAL